MHALSRRLDVRIEWSLAVVLQSMSAAALEGMNIQRTHSVAEHLRTVSESPAVPEELRRTCANLSGLWHTIDLL